MFATLLGTPLIGTILKAILGPLLQTYLTAQKQKLDAAGSHDARVAEVATKALELDKREAEINAQIVLAEQGNWFTRIPRPIMGCSVAILVAKIIVWDLALGQWTGGHTDKLSPQAFWIVTTIIIAYFGSRSVEKVANTVSSIFKK